MVSLGTTAAWADIRPNPEPSGRSLTVSIQKGTEWLAEDARLVEERYEAHSGEGQTRLAAMKEAMKRDIEAEKGHKEMKAINCDF